MTPEEFSDEDLGCLPRATRFTALALRMWADDAGRARLNARSVKGAIFANDMELTLEELEADILRLAEVGFLSLYTADDGRKYFAIAPRFNTAPEKAKVSDLPPPPVRTASGQPQDAVPVVGRGESEAESEEPEGAPTGRHPDAGPPMFCHEHMPSGSGGAPCGPCRDARMVHEAWARSTRSQTRQPRFEDDEEDLT
jgi:hypothetical protein